MSSHCPTDDVVELIVSPLCRIGCCRSRLTQLAEFRRADLAVPGAAHITPRAIHLARLAVLRRPRYEPEWATLDRALPDLRTRIDWIGHTEIDSSASNIRQRCSAAVNCIMCAGAGE